MDPNLIYSRYRDDAFAMQLTATEYTMFVAMPFRNRFSYRADDIYKDVMQAAANMANDLLSRDPGKCGTRRFSTPRRIDDQPQTGRDIGGEIAKAILYAHAVVADLTFANDGVMLEVGASLALKPTNHIVLVTQGSASELHFDIKGNVIIEYSPSNGIGKIAEAMVAAVKDFEERRGEYLTQLSRELSRDAIWLMNWYARCRTGQVFRNANGTPVATSLHEDIGVRAFVENHDINAASDVKKAEAMTRYQLAIRDLLAKRLIWTDYQAQTPQPGVDSFSNRGTRLGWMFLEHKWPGLKCPADEFPSTGGA
jgi:hypothetical protein